MIRFEEQINGIYPQQSIKIFQEYDESRMPMLNSSRLIAEFSVKKLKTNGSAKMINLRFTDDYIIYKKAKIKFCPYGHNLKVYVKYEDKTETSKVKKVLRISLLKKTESFMFADPVKENNINIINILQVKAYFLGFYENFKGFKLIGKSSFAKVFYGHSTYNQEEKAIKTISKKYMKNYPIGKNLIQNEITLMRQISHSNIISLETIYETKNCFYMVFPLFKGGNLTEYIKKSVFLQEKEASTILKVVLNCLHYLHDIGIMHRDIKSENILFKKQDFDENEIFLSDFSLAAYANKKGLTIPKCGTPGYIAPEILNAKDSQVTYDSKCDIFSAGILFYFMLTGKLPYSTNQKNQILDQNSKCDYFFKHPPFGEVSDGARNLFFKMIEKNPEKRITASKALAHEFFTHSKASSLTYDEEIEESMSGLPSENITKINKFKESGKFQRLEVLNQNEISPVVPNLITIKNALNGRINSYTSSLSSENEIIYEKLGEIGDTQDEINDMSPLLSNEEEIIRKLLENEKKIYI